jgi:hypothetical protein
MITVGCGGSAPSTDAEIPPQQRQVKKEPEKRPLSYYESTLRPAMFDADVDSVRRVHQTERQSEQLMIPQDSLVLEEETILGFRIQIFSSSSVDDAAATKMAAQPVFPTDTVYVVYDPPVYKVRVGDYVTRLEANQHLGEVQEKGYADAWIVPDRVIRRKWAPVGRKE